jgi:hypothetical protein
MSLNAVEFNLIDEPKKNRLGFLAQEVEGIVPEAPYRTGDTKHGVEDFYAMDYDQFIPVLTKAIQELKAEVDQLKAS